MPIGASRTQLGAPIEQELDVNGYNFTQRVRNVLTMAREEGARLDHEYVGTEHILLALIREGEGVACTTLQNLGIELDEIRQKIEEGVKRGRGAQTTGPDLPYTSRAKKVLELAMSAARELKHAYVGTEHLLLGLLREEKGIAAQVLTAAGVTPDSARAEILRILGTEPPPRQTAWAEAQPSSGPLERATLASVVVEMRYGEGWRHRREFPTIAAAIAFLAAQG